MTTQEFWQTIYIEVIKSGRTTASALKVANKAVEHAVERWGSSTL